VLIVMLAPVAWLVLSSLQTDGALSRGEYHFHSVPQTVATLGDKHAGAH